MGMWGVWCSWEWVGEAVCPSSHFLICLFLHLPLLESPLAGVAERLLLGLLLVPRGYLISGLLTIWAPWDWDWEAQLG